jgi:excisionase family DNA binding protein
VRGVDEMDHFSERLNHGGLLTVAEVATLLQVPLSWVYDRTRKRGIERIPGFRLGKYWRFREEDVMAWVERQRIGGRPNA